MVVAVQQQRIRTTMLLGSCSRVMPHPLPAHGDRHLRHRRTQVGRGLLRYRVVGRVGAVSFSSDGAGEFGEGFRDPMPWSDVKAEFVMAAVQVLDEGVPCADHSGGAKSFQATHRRQPGL